MSAGVKIKLERIAVSMLLRCGVQFASEVTGWSVGGGSTAFGFGH